MHFEIQDRCLTRNGVKLLRIAIVIDRETGARAIQPADADALIREIAKALNAPEEAKCNGWTNAETWAFNLHMSNTESSANWLADTAAGHVANAEHAAQVGEKIWTVAQARIFLLQDALKDAAESAWSNVTSASMRAQGGVLIEREAGDPLGFADPADLLRMIGDVGSLERVNFREIAEHAVEAALS